MYNAFNLKSMEVFAKSITSDVIRLNAELIETFNNESKILCETAEKMNAAKDISAAQNIIIGYSASSIQRNIANNGKMIEALTVSASKYRDILSANS